MPPQAFEIRAIRGVHLECDLETVFCERRKRDELPEFMRFDAKLETVERCAAVRASPARDGGEPQGSAVGRRRPFVQQRGLPYRPPVNATCGNATPWRADVFANREVLVMIAKMFGGEPLHVPELRITGIEIDEDAPAKLRLERLEREMAADVDEQVRRLRDGNQIALTQTRSAPAGL